MGNQHIVDRINRNRMIFTDRNYIIKDGITLFAWCFVVFFLAFCIGM